MNALLSKSTTQTGKLQETLPVTFPSNDPAAPVRAAVRPTVVSQDYDPIRYRDSERGWITVPVLITRWSDGVTTFNFRVDTDHGEQAVSVRYDAYGPVISVLSGTHENLWYMVNSQRCQCYGFATHHHCKHQQAWRMGRDIIDCWQFAQRKRAHAAKLRQMGAVA